MRGFVILSALLVMLFSVICNCCPSQAANPGESVAIVEGGQSFDISVPVSRLSLRLPKAGFTRSSSPNIGGGTDNPRYFHFEDKKRGIILSGWFEPADRFSGVKEPPPAIFHGTPLVYENVSFSKVGGWEIVSYNVRFDAVVVANLRAHLVRVGTWVELHLSGPEKQPLSEQQLLLVEALRSLEINEKQK